MHLLPILKITISIKMSVVWQSNCRPGCIQFAPAAWPRLAVVWNETSCVPISTFSGLLWKVIWTPTGVCAGFVSYGTESCLLQIFQAQTKIFLCAQLCYASQNTWNNSYLGCLTCQELKIKTDSSPVREQLLHVAHLITALSFYSVTSFAQLMFNLSSLNLSFLACLCRKHSSFFPAILFPPERKYQRARSTLHTETVWQNPWHLQMRSNNLNTLAGTVNFHVWKWCVIISLPTLDSKVCLYSASLDFWERVCLLDMDSS